MKHLIFLFFLLYSTISFSQELKKIAENNVSSTIKVFTYKVAKSLPSSIQDVNTTQLISINQQNTINSFMIIKGVQKASYDQATKTYTVVATTETEIPEKLNFK